MPRRCHYATLLHGTTRHLLDTIHQVAQPTFPNKHRSPSPGSAEVGTSLLEFGPKLAVSVPMALSKLVKFRLKLNEVGPKPAVSGPNSASAGQSLAEVARDQSTIWSMPGQAWSVMGEIGSTLDSEPIWMELAECGAQNRSRPKLAESGPNWSTLVEHVPNVKRSARS